MIGHRVCSTEQYPSGTHGGSSVSTSFNIRKPSTEVAAGGDSATYSSTTNEIILQPGSYEDCTIWALGLHTNAGHQVRLRDNIRGVTVINGSSEFSHQNDNIVTRSVGFGSFTTSVGRVYQLQHYINAGFATIGFGSANTTGEPEIYAGIKCQVGGI